MKELARSLEQGAAERGGEHQNLRRMSLALDALAHSPQGLRLAEIANVTRLGKATVHRLMNGLLDLGWVDLADDEVTYLLGFRPLALALAAADRYSLVRLSASALQRIADATEDTVYLSLRSGTESVCVARYEGDFPVKTLTLSVGERRPLGVGAGSLALLAFQDDESVAHLIASTSQARARYQIGDETLRGLIVAARRNGYTVNDGMLVQGMSAVGVPVRASSGQPVAAFSVAAISSRLAGSRSREVADMLRAAASEAEERLRAALDLTTLGAG